MPTHWTVSHGPGQSDAPNNRETPKHRKGQRIAASASLKQEINLTSLYSTRRSAILTLLNLALGHKAGAKRISSISGGRHIVLFLCSMCFRHDWVAMRFSY
jgi:hypothetical protein